MKVNNDIKQYLRQIRSQLQCSRRKRTGLMKPLLRSMQSYLLENDDVSYDDLVNAFGTPKEMSAMLTEKIPESEISRYRRCKTIQNSLLILLCVSSILLLVYTLFFSTMPVEVTQTIIIE